MLHHPSPSRSAEAPLAGGDGATPPPVASSAAARSPRAAATPSRERRLKDERPIVTPAIAPEDWARDPFADLDASVGPMRLAVVALMCAMLGVPGMFALTLAYVGGLL